jgi:hypothetical protein
LKSLVTLHLAVLHDAGLLCAIDVQRDSIYLESRWEHEGDSFLTITLPTFAKALERGLATGVWPRQPGIGFDLWRGLPRFLGGFLTSVFSLEGTILDDPDADCIWAIRQICNLTGKLERPCTPERERAARSQFIQTDEELEDHFLKGLDPELWASFNRWTRFLFSDLFDQLETKVANYDLIPKHGPGAVADKLTHLERWDFGYWTERLAEVFPPEIYAQNAITASNRALTTPSAELPVRVVSVPKTQKTPRIIAIEPSTVQYAQQGLKREIYKGVEDSHFLSGILGFTDQSRNQQLARESSLRGDLATLDLSEASDRVHVEVAEELFHYHPHLRDFVMATRSSRANVDGEILNLAKFASMGSALTFPIEGMIFTIIAAMGVWGSDVPARHAMHGKLSVYGDDIIVPVHSVDRVIHLLEAFGFKVNSNKSFWTGKFRESCGADFYNGHDVSVVRLRAEVPTSRGDAALINRFVDFRNRCFHAGLWRTVKAADEYIDKIIRIPSRNRISLAESDAIAKDTFLRTKWRGQWNADLQTWEERFPRAVGVTTTYKVDGESGLLKWFQENHDRNDRYQTDRYESQERAHTFHIKWVRLEIPA